MITRFVKLTIKVDQIVAFQKAFSERNKVIESFQGCQKVELLQDVNDKRVFFTFSEWNKEDDLENYRNSDFFQDTWSTVKPMFDGKPEAWSLNVL